MPKYYCDYCDTFLTHDSPSVRKTHNGGRKHKENVRMYYQNWMEQQAQKLVDATARAFTQQRMLVNNAQFQPPMPMPGRPPIMAPGMMRPPGMQFPYLPQGMAMGMPRPGMPQFAGMPGAPPQALPPHMAASQLLQPQLPAGVPPTLPTAQPPSTS